LPQQQIAESFTWTIDVVDTARFPSPRRVEQVALGDFHGELGGVRRADSFSVPFDCVYRWLLIPLYCLKGTL
jgi:hypothetical protein